MEEEAEKYIKELFLRLSPKPDDLSGSSSKGRDNFNAIYTLSVFLRAIIELSFSFLYA